MQRVFYYQARDRNGKLLTGEIEASSIKEAAANIQLNGYFITKLREKQSKEICGKFRQYLVNSNKYKIALLFHQLALLLEAGIPILQSLDTLQNEVNDNELKKIIARLSELLQCGISLSQAMQSQQQYFSNFIICLIEVGENSGKLDEILQRLSGHLGKEFQQQEKLKSALAYPLFVMLFAVCVLLVLALYVLPVFAELFSSMQLTLPLPTQLLFKITDIMQVYGIWLLLIFSVTIAGWNYCWRKPACRNVIERIVIKIPKIGGVIVKLEAALFARALSILLESGVPLLKALSLTAKVSRNQYIGSLWLRLKSDIKLGISFSEAIKKLPIKATLLVQMVAVGEKTGKLEFMLNKTAVIYEEAVHEKMRRFGALLEPCLTIVLGIVVGGIVISIAMPIFESITQAIS